MPNSNRPDLTLVIPAKNEEDRIAKTLSNYGSFFEAHANECVIEVVVVITDTVDTTYEEAGKYAKKYPFIKILRTPYATGKGGAVALGFSNATGKYVGFADADGAVPPAEIFKLYALLKETDWLDGVIGSRSSTNVKMSLKRKVIAGIYNFYVRLFFGLSYHDTQCGLKIFKNKLAKDLGKKLLNVGWTFDVNILLIAKHMNMQILECPVIWNERDGSKFSLFEAVYTVPLELFRLKRAELLYKIKFSWPEVYSKKKRNVLIFSWRDLKHTEHGGSETYIHSVAQRLTAKYNVTLFTSRPGNLSHYDSVDKVKIIRRGSKYTVYFWAMFYYIFKLRYHTDFIVDVENGIPFFTPLYSDKPKILLVHHVHKHQWFVQYPWAIAVFGYVLEMFLMPILYKSTLLVTVSRSSMEELRAIGFNSKKTFIAYNSIPPKVGSYKTKFKIPTLLYIGRLKAYKRVELALQLIPALKKRYPNIKLVIGGDGDCFDRISKLAKKLKVENSVELLGYVSERKKWELLQKAWLFLMPSSKEGWGITVIEAAKCATPAVGFDVPGVRDSIQNKYSGLLAKDGSLSDFLNQVDTLLKDASLRKSLGKNSKVWADKFKWGTTAKIFELLIEGKAPKYNFFDDKLYPWDLDLGSDFVTTLADIIK